MRTSYLAKAPDTSIGVMPVDKIDGSGDTVELERMTNKGTIDTLTTALTSNPFQAVLRIKNRTRA